MNCGTPCTFLKSECTPSVVTDSILVVGGLIHDGTRDNQATDTVELLRVDSGSSPRNLRKFPRKIHDAFGTTLG